VKAFGVSEAGKAEVGVEVGDEVKEEAVAKLGPGGKEVTTCCKEGG
jgi:hypothetical protein